MTANKSLQKTNPVKFKQVKDVDDLKRRAMTIGFYGIAGFLGYKFLLQPALEKYRKKHEQNTLLDDPNKLQATVLYNAMNPSGISWMRSFDKTNEDMIYEAARKITDWNAVQTTYRNLYTRDLLSDLQSELDTEEYQTFIKILNQSKGSGNNPAASTANKGMIIASKVDIRLRSTPDSSDGTFTFNSNILGTAKASKFLGWATGKQQVDNKGVKYLEVMIKFNEEVPSGVFNDIYKKNKSKTISFWAGAGAIHQFRFYKQMNDAGIKLYKGVSDMGLRKDFK